MARETVPEREQIMNDQIATLIAQYEQESDFTHVAPTDEMIESAQRLLGVTIPEQFIEYLNEHSYGGVGGVEILGVGFTGEMLFVDTTLWYREYGLPHNLLAVENCDEWLYCLDCDTGEVVSWSRCDGVLPQSPCFDVFLLQDLEDAIEGL
jgi:hypothetical protein